MHPTWGEGGGVGRGRMVEVSQKGMHPVLGLVIVERWSLRGFPGA